MQSERMAFKLTSVYILMFCFAVSISLVGQMLVPIREYYGISIQRANLLLSAQSIGGVLIAFISILFIDSLNQRKIIVFAGILLAAALMCVSILPMFIVAGMIFAAVGISAGAINILSNSVIVGLAKNNKQRYLTMMHMVFSIGAFVIPLAAQSIFNLGGVRGTFLIIGTLMLVCAVVAVSAFNREVRAPLKTDRLHIGYRFAEVMRVLRIPGMKLIFVLAVIISTWQMCAIYNLSGAVSAINSNPAEGAIALSALFLGMVVSRLLYSAVADRFSQGRVMAVMNAVGAVLWVGAMLIPIVAVKVVLVGLTAVACGVNFPAAFGASCKIAYKNTATGAGLVSLGYYFAIFVFCPITGRLCDALGYDTALLLLIIPLLLALPLGLLLHKRMKDYAGVDY